MVQRNPAAADLEPIERASRDELKALQLQRMQWSLKHAYDNVPHYRAAFDAAGVHPDDLKTLADLSKFPFTGKKDLRENYPFGMFAVPREQVVRVHASSGTTGQPTVVGYTQNDIDTWANVVARSIRAAGGRRGDMVHISYGYGLFTGGLGAHYGAERLGCTVIPMSGGQTEKQVQLIRDFKPDIIMVTPSYMLNIIEEFQRQGLDPAASSLKVDIYGLSEVMGPGVASECIESKDGPVIWEDHFYPEIIDPETGAVLPDGEEGELVFTSLTKEALPIIRYRTRDLTRLLPPTSRAMRRIGKITGRSDDMMIIRGVNVFPSQIEEQILKMPQLAPQYQLVVSRDGHLDKLEVIVELCVEAAGISSSDGSALARELEHRIKTNVGVNTKVRLQAPNSIERTLTGKARRVVDQRPKN